jgi:transposase
VVFIDECGVNTFMTRTHGRAPRGERLNTPQPGRKYKRVNVIAGWNDKMKQYIAPYIFPWNTNSAWFLVWFEFMLLPLLKPDTLIVLDNASFHRRKEIEKMAKLYHFVPVFLPKYSPDFNLIEKCWANLKNWLRLHSKKFSTIQLAIQSRLSM